MTITKLKDNLIALGLYVQINDIDEEIYVYESKSAEQIGDWFIKIPFDALIFLQLTYDSSAVYLLGLETIAGVETLISLFLMTPEEERGFFEVTETEEQYVIPMPGLITSSGHRQYLAEKDGKYFSCRRNEGLHQVFTESELEAVPAIYREYAESYEVCD